MSGLDDEAAQNGQQDGLHKFSIFLESVLVVVIVVHQMSPCHLLLRLKKVLPSVPLCRVSPRAVMGSNRTRKWMLDKDIAEELTCPEDGEAVVLQAGKRHCRRVKFTIASLGPVLGKHILRYACRSAF